MNCSNLTNCLNRSSIQNCIVRVGRSAVNHPKIAILFSLCATLYFSKSCRSFVAGYTPAFVSTGCGKAKAAFDRYLGFASKKVADEGEEGEKPSDARADSKRADSKAIPTSKDSAPGDGKGSNEGVDGSNS